MLHNSFMHIKEYRLQRNRTCKSSYNSFKTAVRQTIFLAVLFVYLSFYHFAGVNMLTREKMERRYALCSSFFQIRIGN